ncbi:MAG TPA: AAA family ATPase [Candidatus Baltobacteraceae bacterium]
MISRLPTLPKLAPATIRRARIGNWMQRHVRTPLRLVVGPPGAGKTTAVASFLEEIDARIAYLTVQDDESATALRTRIAEALGLGAVEGYSGLIEALGRCGACQLALDEIDHAAAETLDELEAIVNDAPKNVSLIYIARSRTAVDVGRLVARGLAAILDAELLAFNAEDVAHLADASGVSFTAFDVGRLLDETEGWPVVVSCVIREAADRNGSLAGAYDQWCRSGGRHFAAFIKGEIDRQGDFYRTTFHLVMRGGSGPEHDDRLAALEASGLFVRYADGTCRPYRVVLQFVSGGIRSTVTPMPSTGALLTVRMFGRFQASIGERPIEWIRRRDAQLFKFLLLTPNGTATRNQLRQQFWPDADAQLATQSLRTSCSNIRRAIAAIVGYENVDRYFSTRGEIGVKLSNAVLDVRRFTAHITDGDEQLQRSNVREAVAHYHAAENLYSGELLSGDYPEPWYIARAAMYQALYIGALERLADLHTDLGEVQQGCEYRERVSSLKTAARLVESLPATNASSSRVVAT